MHSLDPNNNALRLENDRYRRLVDELRRDNEKLRAELAATRAEARARLLALRWNARNEPTQPASTILSDAEISCLRLPEKRKRRRLPARPTVADALLAIARLGGFLTQNKTPGWLVLGRGWEGFQKMFSVYDLMKGGAAEM
jgi:hypothetical protein